MKRLAGLVLLLLTGCSTTPLADFMDHAFPPRPIPPNTPWYGGVGVPQPAPPPNAVIPFPETAGTVPPVSEPRP